MKMTLSSESSQIVVPAWPAARSMPVGDHGVQRLDVDEDPDRSPPSLAQELLGEDGERNDDDVRDGDDEDLQRVRRESRRRERDQGPRELPEAVQDAEQPEGEEGHTGRAPSAHQQQSQREEADRADERCEDDARQVECRRGRL